MLQKGKLTLATLGVTILAATIFAVTKPRQPSYNGVSLESWVLQYAEGCYGGIPDIQRKKEAADALRAISDRGFPYLLTWIDSESSIPKKWRDTFLDVVEKLPDSFKLEDTFFKSDPLAYPSEVAFGALGEQGSNAIPRLIKILTNRNKRSSARGASGALSFIGKSAVPALAEIIVNKECPNRDLAADALGWMRNLDTNGMPAIPILLQALDDSDPDLAGSAIEALQLLALDPEHVIPPLIKILNNTNSNIRLSAIFALGVFNKSATSAVPDLIAAKDRAANLGERQAIDVALEKINLEKFPFPRSQLIGSHEGITIPK